MSESKQPVILLMMRDGCIQSVISDTKNVAEVIMVNLCSKGSPQEDLQEVTITLPDDNEPTRLLCNITRIGVKTAPDPKDTVVQQFKSHCPEGEYDIDHVEHITVKKDGSGKIIVNEAGEVGMHVGNVVTEFAEIYQQEFGVPLEPDDLLKYKPD